jgi:hypothetical protein
MQGRTGVARCSRPDGCGAVACQQLIGALSGRSGYDCLVEGSRGSRVGGSLRLAAALIPSLPGTLACGQFDVARGCAGSRVMVGPFARYSGDARPLAAFV